MEIFSTSEIPKFFITAIIPALIFATWLMIRLAKNIAESYENPAKKQERKKAKFEAFKAVIPILSLGLFATGTFLTFYGPLGLNQSSFWSDQCAKGNASACFKLGMYRFNSGQIDGSRSVLSYACDIFSIPTAGPPDPGITKGEPCFWLALTYRGTDKPNLEYEALLKACRDDDQRVQAACQDLYLRFNGPENSDKGFIFEKMKKICENGSGLICCNSQKSIKEECKNITKYCNQNERDEKEKEKFCNKDKIKSAWTPKKEYLTNYDFLRPKYEIKFSSDKDSFIQEKINKSHCLLSQKIEIINKGNSSLVVCKAHVEFHEFDMVGSTGSVHDFSTNQLFKKLDKSTPKWTSPDESEKTIFSVITKEAKENSDKIKEQLNDNVGCEAEIIVEIPPGSAHTMRVSLLFEDSEKSEKRYIFKASAEVRSKNMMIRPVPDEAFSMPRKGCSTPPAVPAKQPGG